MRILALPLSALALAAAAPSVVQAAPVTTAASHYTAEATDIGTLLDDPAARAVVNKYVPGFSDDPQVGMARGMTLKGVQGYAPDKFSDAVLAKIDADLAKLSAKK